VVLRLSLIAQSAHGQPLLWDASSGGDVRHSGPGLAVK
jgi:hypothetical protein